MKYSFPIIPIILIALLSCKHYAHAQNKITFEEQQIDSLNKLINDPSTHDTLRISIKTDIGQLGVIFREGYWDSLYNESVGLLDRQSTTTEKNALLFYAAGALNNLGYVQRYYGKYDTALATYYSSISLIQSIKAEKDSLIYIQSQRDYAQTLNNIAVVYINQGDTKKGIEYYEKSMKLRLKLNDKEGAALTLNNLGYVASQQGDIKKALEFYFSSLKLREEINDYYGLAQVVGNIAIQYASQNQTGEAMHYYRKSLKYWGLAQSADGEATALNNIGTYYLEEGNIDSAQYYYNKALTIRDSLNIKEDVANSYYNLGNLFAYKGELGEAINYFIKSLKLYQELSYKENICKNYDRIAASYFLLKKYEEAEEYSNQAYTLAQELGYPEQVSSASKLKYIINKEKGNFRDALDMYELHITMRDSLKNELNKKQVLKQQLQYEYEKQKALDNKEHEKQMAVSAEVKKKQKTIIYSVSTGFG